MVLGYLFLLKVNWRTFFLDKFCCFWGPVPKFDNLNNLGAKCFKS